MGSPAQAPIAVLRKPLGQAIRQGHPWVFAAALSLPPGLASGTAVDLHDDRGRFIARGLYDADSPIALRLWTRRPEEAIDAELLRRRLRQAAALRRPLIDRAAVDAWRLVHGEADGLPGLVVDRYGDTAVVKTDSPAVAGLLRPLAEALLAAHPDLCRVVERQTDGPLRALAGELPLEPLQVREHGLVLEADLQRGHKTGLYLDQRENRRRVGRLAVGRRVLNLFAYTGGFSVAAALGGASQVCSVDVAAPALEAARRNFALSGLDPAETAYSFVTRDCLDFLQGDKRQWDLIVLDPPSMAPSAAARPKALGQYRLLNQRCLERLSPGGILVSCSCSSHVGAADLRSCLAEAAAQAGRELRLFDLHGAGPDHPMLPGFPEGDYLQVWYGMVA